MGDDLDLYDTGNFVLDHPQYSESNRRVLGKLKSETGSSPPSEFVGLRANMYSLVAPNKSFTKVKGGGSRKTMSKTMCDTKTLWTFCGMSHATHHVTFVVSDRRITW